MAPSLSRTVRQAEDLAWLPPHVRALRWSVSGALWGGAGLATLATLVTLPGAIVAWKLIAAGGVGLAVASDRLGKRLVERHVARLARGEVELSGLRHRDEGTPVHVRGRVELLGESLTGVLHGTPGVARRLVYAIAAGRWVHEAACDFALVDDAGGRVFVRVAGARILAARGELVSYPTARVAAAMPPGVAAALTSANVERVPAWELVVRVGTMVDIVGFKTTTPDASGDGGSYREPPQRATLQGGTLLPLIITPLTELG